MLQMVALLLVGELLLEAGLWLAWPPLALIAGGMQLVAVGLLRRSA